MSKAWSAGSSRAWRRLRVAILDRDQYRCQIRSASCTTVATAVDHIVSRASGGTDDPANLRAACAPCNASRGASAPDPPATPRTVW